MTILLSFKLSQNLKYPILADSTYQSAKILIKMETIFFDSRRLNYKTTERKSIAIVIVRTTMMLLLAAKQTVLVTQKEEFSRERRDPLFVFHKNQKIK